MPTEPVLALEIDGDAWANPVQMLIWQEIVNATVGARPVAVTYCPLCNTAIALTPSPGVLTGSGLETFPMATVPWGV